MRRTSPRSIASRAPSVSRTTKRRLWSESRRSPSSSFWFTRWRMYARVKRAQAGQSHPSSSGDSSRAKRAFRRLSRPARGERAAGAGGAGRQDAVEHVDPRLDHLEDPFRVADPHEVARLVRREQRRRPVGRLEHHVAVLADREPADRVAVEADRGDLLDRPAAQLRVDAALADAEAQLALGARRLVSAARPTRSCGARPLRARAATRSPAAPGRGTSRCRCRGSPGCAARARA